MKKIVLLAFSLLFITTYGCDDGTQKNKDTNIKTSSETISKENDKKGTIHLTKQDFIEKVMDFENNAEWKFAGDKPCLIDFYADWCRPCKIAEPILEELAEEYKDQINIYKIDTQKEQELAQVFGIQSIPAFLFCPMNGKPQMSMGIGQTPEQTKEMFKQMIETYLLKNNNP